jgi:GNAT superfamily N-acetyltransferase
MSACGSIEISYMGEAALPATLRLQEVEQWNQSTQDWRRLLRFGPEGCFAAYSGAELVGTVTVVSYGRNLAWIGMMLVARQFRGRGIGRRLMRAALDYCQRGGIPIVKLDATPAGKPLYESLGFIPELEIERWQGSGNARVENAKGSPCIWELPAEAYSLDERAFGVSRKELLKTLLQDSCVAPALDIDATTQSLRGFGLARPGARASYIGPVVGVDRDVCLRLVDGLLQQLAGPVFVDVANGARGREELMTQRGFVRQRCLTQMSLGHQTTRTPEMVFAIAGPELG